MSENVLNIDWLALLLTFTSWGYYFSMFLSALIWSSFRCFRIERLHLNNIKNRAYSLMIPALNEEAVIANTIRMLAMINYPKELLEIIVINDGSDDNTATKVQEIISNPHINLHVELLNVPRNIARQGKGTALNRGYDYLVSNSRFRDDEDWIIGIIDADGRMDFDLLHHANIKFSVPMVGAVNSSIRIRNRYDEHIPIDQRKPWKYEWLTTLQDIEFVATARVINYVRGTVFYNSFMGGNGQFMRREVLDELKKNDGYIWDKDALTEDLSQWMAFKTNIFAVYETRRDKQTWSMCQMELQSSSIATKRKMGVGKHTSIYEVHY